MFTVDRKNLALTQVRDEARAKQNRAANRAILDEGLHGQVAVAATRGAGNVEGLPPGICAQIDNLVKPDELLPRGELFADGSRNLFVTIHADTAHAVIRVRNQGAR